MSSNNNDNLDDNWELDYEKKRQFSLNKILRSRCIKCGKKCEDVGEYTLGETHNNNWYCFDHVELLYKSLGVNTTSEFWDKTGRYR